MKSMGPDLQMNLSGYQDNSLNNDHKVTLFILCLKHEDIPSEMIKLYRPETSHLGLAKAQKWFSWFLYSSCLRRFYLTYVTVFNMHGNWQLSYFCNEQKHSNGFWHLERYFEWCNLLREIIYKSMLMKGTLILYSFIPWLGSSRPWYCP